MSGLREVRIVIGKRSYRIQTALSEDTLERVISMVADVSQNIGDGVEQESLLLLTCLQFAYSLDKISRRVTPLVDALEQIEPFKPDKKK